VTDSAGADTEATEGWSRRALVGAGVVGAVLLAAEAGSAAAAPARLSPDDADLVRFAIGVELSARDLYRAAIDAGATGTAWGIFVSQHAAYAQRLAGISGISANTRAPAVYDERVADFTGARPANAAFQLENSLIVTHADLLGMIVDANVADAIASIAAMESHHAAYLAERTGRGGDFDALFGNTASPILPVVGS
jgi:hypothetical protein